MARIAAESLIERPAAWGVGTVFGLPGEVPGRATCRQAEKFTEAFPRGRPHKTAIATTPLKNRIRQKGD
ncbi:hypothetical protein [Microtetraspora malaysiensis]|uniref:hypothetical protein n=1 Tax=Microtetraspora malaysiensis TaxID=161358 RepID=UPI00082C4266|nr:hypothetical protein [Microtetraspora malaysiensis]